MPGLVPGIHDFHTPERAKDVDGRDKPGHDERERVTFPLTLIINSVTKIRITRVDDGRRRPPIGRADAVLRRVGRPPWRQPRWSAGRRRAPEAGGPRKRIVLWRAPRPKRERVVTSVRVARSTTLAPPGAPSLPFREAFRGACAKLGR